MSERLFRLSLHDRYRIEVKFDYLLDSARPREQFLMDLFLFVPPSLDVNPDTYSKARFYEDLQTYTRYATPPLTPAELLDGSNDLSPLARLARMHDRWREAPPDEAEQRKAIYELRLLGCVARVHNRDAGRRIAARLAASDFEHAERAGLAEEAERLAAEAQQLGDRLRAWRAAPGVWPSAVDRAWRRVDEALSVHLEATCGKLHRAVGSAHAKLDAARPGAARLAAAARSLAAVMRAEEERRGAAGYPTQLAHAAAPAHPRVNEDYLRRVAALKKYVQRVLFLSVAARQGSRPLLYLLYALAAMGAMAVFVIALWLFQGVAPLNSLPYVLLAALAYAFKDRLKDALKQLFSAHMAEVLNDREGKLLDRGPARAAVGRTAEAFSFVPLERVPADARALHERDELTQLEEEGAPDLVMRYQKSLTLFNARIFRVHRRVSSINEILRYNLRHFLYDMDEPQKPLILPPAAAEDRGPRPAEVVQACRTYTVGLALGVRAQDAAGRRQTQWEGYRIVLNRDGILRIETAGGQAVEQPD